jgi:hypothetical protein
MPWPVESHKGDSGWHVGRDSERGMPTTDKPEPAQAILHNIPLRKPERREAVPGHKGAARLTGWGLHAVRCYVTLP